MLIPFFSCLKCINKPIAWNVTDFTRTLVYSVYFSHIRVAFWQVFKGLGPYTDKHILRMHGARIESFLDPRSRHLLNRINRTNHFLCIHFYEFTSTWIQQNAISYNNFINLQIGYFNIKDNQQFNYIFNSLTAFNKVTHRRPTYWAIANRCNKDTNKPLPTAIIIPPIVSCRT